MIGNAYFPYSTSCELSCEHLVTLLDFKIRIGVLNMFIVILQFTNLL